MMKYLQIQVFDVDLTQFKTLAESLNPALTSLGTNPLTAWSPDDRIFRITLSCTDPEASQAALNAAVNDAIGRLPDRSDIVDQPNELDTQQRIDAR